MEETLTDCLVRVREDLKNLKRVREYLDQNKESEGCCYVTWRTIETFNSILGVCSSQETPESNALDTLLDSFYYLARNNTEPSVWNDFGFELGIICVKVLSAIERSEIFEVLFCKLLTVINVICEHNTNVWKASARQILNLLINKKFSLSYFESVLKLCICILRNIDGSALHNFSSQNLHLLKTLSTMVQRIGDFEIQSDIIELVFLHLSNNTALMSDFFASAERKLFESLQFTHFDEDCRTYLNALNKPRGGLEKKVYSIRCHVLYLGGCFVEPPVGANSLWMDANVDTKRLSIRCADVGSESNRVIYILFSDVLNVQLANEKTEGSRCLTIQTKSLSELQFDVKNDDVCLMVDNGEALFEMVNFLSVEIKRKNKLRRKVSKTIKSLCIDRNAVEEVQDNAVTSSEKPVMDHILPDILNLFENANPAAPAPKAVTRKPATPPRSQEQKARVDSQELSPNSFVESLNQHIGRDSPDIPRTFEDSIETIEFLERNAPAENHKLFRSPCKAFEMIGTEEPSNFSFIFDDEKENKPGVETLKPKLRTYERRQERPKPPNDPLPTRVLRDMKNLQAKFGNSQSQDYFVNGANVLKKKKPALPKLRRSSKAKTPKPESKVEEKEERKRSARLTALRESVVRNEEEVKEQQREFRKKSVSQEKENKQENENRERRNEDEREKRKRGFECKKQQKQQVQQNLEKEAKPSLLDPNGYAYRRWCEPTTSERSNFWLKKLSEVQKPKADADVFNFFESSDSDSAKIKRKKRRVVHSKRNQKTTKQTSLKEVKEILRKASPKEKQKSVGESTKVTSPKVSPRPEPPPPRTAEPPHDSPHNSAAESDSDPYLPNDGNSPATPQSPDSSEEDIPVRKTNTERKPKTVLLSENLLSVLRSRLVKKAEKDKRQTEEIISAVNKAVSHVFNHLQRKEGESVMSYLKAAEKAVAAVECEVEGLSLRGIRTERAMLYLKAGCSVVGACESVEGEFSGVRSALGGLRQRKEVSETVSRVNERLLGLIKSGIDRSIESEMASRRRRLLKCASIFDVECGKF